MSAENGNKLSRVQAGYNQYKLTFRLGLSPKDMSSIVSNMREIGIDRDDTNKAIQTKAEAFPELMINGLNYTEGIIYINPRAEREMRRLDPESTMLQQNQVTSIKGLRTYGEIDASNGNNGSAETPAQKAINALEQYQDAYMQYIDLTSGGEKVTQEALLETQDALQVTQEAYAAVMDEYGDQIPESKRTNIEMTAAKLEKKIDEKVGPNGNEAAHSGVVFKAVVG